MLKVVRPFAESTGLKNLALAGGIFANVKLNTHLFRELGMEQSAYGLFIASLPHRYYPWLMLLVGVLVLSITGESGVAFDGFAGTGVGGAGVGGTGVGAVGSTSSKKRSWKKWERKCMKKKRRWLLSILIS